MKQKNSLITAIVVLFSIMFVSCKKSFFTNINQNPNVLNNVPPNLLLPTVEAGIGYTQGGDLSRQSSMLVQQTLGANSQMQAFYIYGYNPGAFDAPWSNLYTTIMENNYSLMKVADASGDNVYSGISRILMAYTLQLAVDNWGDVPYSAAFQANISGGSIHPTYDKGQGLYDTIASLIDAGIVELNNSNAGTLVPSSDDFIYGGATASWIKFGHAVKARLYIHQSKNNATMANKALAEIQNSFTSEKDNAQYLFGNTATSANPWYQFNNQRAGNIEFHTAPFAQTLIALKDPRYTFFIDSTNEDGGLDKTNMHYGGLNNYYGSSNSPVEFITYEELLFIQAEATLNAGGKLSDAQTYYTAAITANMTKLGVTSSDIATYLVANGTLNGTSASALSQIATQEYIALYLNPETWTLWRRTGYPSLTPTAGTAIPRRLEYPQTEYNYNVANVPASTLFTPRIFWDK